MKCLKGHLVLFAQFNLIGLYSDLARNWNADFVKEIIDV